MNNFELLETCYITGQMSEEQLNIHFKENPMFFEWFKRREAKRRETYPL